MKNISIIYTITITNLVIYGLSIYFGLDRPLINIDYILIAITSLFAIRLLSSLLAAILITIDISNLIAQVLPFTRLRDLIYYIEINNTLPISYRLYFILTIILIISLSAWLGYLSNKSSTKNTLLSLNILLLLYSYGVYFYKPESNNSFYRQKNPFFVDSQGIYFYNYRTTGFINEFNKASFKFENSIYKQGFKDLLDEQNIDHHKKVILILNESFAYYNNNKLNDYFISQINAPNVNINTGKLNFSGVTVEAELKELCGKRPSSLNLKKQTSPKDFEDCLPMHFKSKGYENYAYHGASGLMYDRSYWYPRAGFENVKFYEHFSKAEKCFSFPGKCDKDIIQYILDDLSNSELSFHYWLTLNTHHDYNLKDLSIPTPSCEFFELYNDAACRNAKLQAQFFYYLNNMLKNLEKNTLIYIIGDHMPPIIDQNVVEKYFERNTIPWIKIVIN